MDIGTAVKTLRKQAGISQDTLADLAGTTKPSISRIETGEQVPSMDMLERIAAALGVRIYQIMAAAEGVTLPVAHASKEEMKMLNAYRVMEPEAQYHLTAVADALVRPKK